LLSFSLRVPSSFSFLNIPLLFLPTQETLSQSDSITSMWALFLLVSFVLVCFLASWSSSSLY
jgi:hypothetical protein